MSNRFMRMAAAPALALGALTSSVAMPFAAANAQETAVAAQVAANSNIRPAAVSTLTVQYVDATRETRDGVGRFAAAASNNKVAIVVWGGTRAIQQEAYNAALDLVDMGIPTAFVLAPDDNGLDGDAVMQVYAASAPTGNDARYGTNYANLVRADMREAGIEAYRAAFPERAAALNL